MCDSAVLAIDVGNSRIKVGLFNPSCAEPLPCCLAATAFPTSDENLVPAIEAWLSEQAVRPSRAVAGGVQSNALGKLHWCWNSETCDGDRIPLQVVDRPAPERLRNSTDEPDRVGADRLFDAVAANRLRRASQPAIVVDSGTATTVDFVDGRGEFHGGAIIAGFGIMAAALHERTARLPLIDMSALTQPPDPLGRNTTDALRSGLYWGLVGGVRELVERYSQIALETTDEPPLLLLTGGAASLLAPRLTDARHEPYLTLQGLILSADCKL